MTPKQTASWIATASLLLLAACADDVRLRNVEYEPGRFYFDWPRHNDLTDDVRRSFRDRLMIASELVGTKLQDSVVLDALGRENQRGMSKPISEILEDDMHWQQSGPDDARAAALVDQPCSRALELFRDGNADVAEVFVTGIRGTNVCQSNKTSDYYQADEDWWQNTLKRRVASYGQPEYDESAGVVAVAVYQPVDDPETGDLIGIAKAVVRRSVREAGS